MDESDESVDERQARAERLAALKRYNMKSLGRLVDSSRMTGASRPDPVASDLPQTLPIRSAPSPVEEPVPDTSEQDSIDDAPAVDGFTIEPVVVQPGHDGATPHPIPSEPDRSAVDAESIDGIDRADMGGNVTRSGLSTRLDEPFPTRRDIRAFSSSPLARQMLDGEISTRGRISDPRDVPGLVLVLAKDVPASVAVSVVRIDEEVEIVGDTLEPGIDPSVFSSVFSELFRSIRPAAKVLEDGPMGAIQDVVIEGEKMDLILRPLGSRYYLMVLEDRKDSRANLALTRMHMTAIAPGLAAILAQQDGDA